MRREDSWVGHKLSTIVQPNPCPPLDISLTLHSYAAAANAKFHKPLRSRPNSLPDFLSCSETIESEEVGEEAI